MQQQAASAVDWCKEKGGTVESTDVVQRLANLATAGQHPQNAERDFHTMIRSFAKRFGARIDTVQVRMYSHANASVEWQPVDIIYPDQMAAALLKKERAWQKTMFGDLPPSEVQGFWEHCKGECDWFRDNPCFGYPPTALKGLIPLSLYGDDVAAWKGSEAGSVTAIGWSSDFSFKNSSLLRYFPIAIYPEYCSTEHSFEDIMSHVTPRLKAMTDPCELWPWSDRGFCFAMSSLQGDLKWVLQHFHLHNYHKNSFCSLCGVVKSHETDVGMTLANFAEDAPHASAPPDLTDFERNRA